MGDIQQVRIGHDNTSTNAMASNANLNDVQAKKLSDQACKWQLDKVVVKKRGGELIIFGCAEWLDRNSGDNTIERDLYPGERVFNDNDGDTVTNPLGKESGEEGQTESPDRKLILGAISSDFHFTVRRLFCDCFATDLGPFWHAQNAPRASRTLTRSLVASLTRTRSFRGTVKSSERPSKFSSNPCHTLIISHSTSSLTCCSITDKLLGLQDPGQHTAPNLGRGIRV